MKKLLFKKLLKMLRIHGRSFVHVRIEDLACESFLDHFGLWCFNMIVIFHFHVCCGFAIFDVDFNGLFFCSDNANLNMFQALQVFDWRCLEFVCIRNPSEFPKESSLLFIVSIGKILLRKGKIKLSLNK